MDTDIFARMSDVELMVELRRIAFLAGQRRNLPLVQRASELFDVFYAHRLRRTLPDWVWEDRGAFVRQHAN